MKRLVFLLMSCLLLCSVAYADQRDTGPAWEQCKVFDLSALDNLVAHVSPGMPVLDSGLRFDRIDQGAGVSTLAHADYERQHCHNIDPGGAAVDSKRLSYLGWRHTSVMRS